MKRHPIYSVEKYPMPSIEVTLYFSPEKMLRDFGERGVQLEKLISGEDFAAQVQPVMLDGDPVYVVLLDDKKVCDLSEDQQRELLVHEAVHVAYRYFEHIGEQKPGEETWAYTVQTVASELFSMYSEHLEAK